MGSFAWEKGKLEVLQGVFLYDFLHSHSQKSVQCIFSPYSRKPCKILNIGKDLL